MMIKSFSCHLPLRNRTDQKCQRPYPYDQPTKPANERLRLRFYNVPHIVHHDKKFYVIIHRHEHEGRAEHASPEYRTSFLEIQA